MKKTISLIAFATILLLFGCSKTEIDQPVQDLSGSKGQFKTDVIIPIYILQNQVIGSINVFNNGTGLTINGNISGWEFKESHIYVGTAEPENHNPTQFPFEGTITSPHTLEFSISFEELGANCGDFYIAFHAKVKEPNGSSEHAWAIPQTGAFYWYSSSGGNQIGWGAYFAYNVNCETWTYTIESAGSELNNVYAQAKFRNMLLNGTGDEIQFWPNAGVSGMEAVDFGTENYLFNPGTNHIKLVFTPYIVTDEGSIEATLTSRTTVSAIFDYGLDVTPTEGFNVIQFALYNQNALENFELTHIKINGVSVGDLYEGRDPVEMWDITGNLLVGPGVCQFEADLILGEPASSAESNYVLIRFGSY